MYLVVMSNPNISPAAKAVYAYLAARCGASDECYPSVETIIREMGMVKDTFYRHINALIAAGIVEKKQSISENGKFGRTIYRLTHEVTISEKQDFPCPDISTTDKSITEDSETKDNSLKYNSKKDIILYSPDGERETPKEESQTQEPDKKTALQQDMEDFEKIYAAYPKKQGKAKAFEYYRGYVGKGRVINGIRYRLDRKEIYLAVVAYARQMEEAGTQLQYYKNFDTFMNKAVLDYLPERTDAYDIKR